MKVPLLPTLVAGAAIGFMIYLGLWQLDRLHQKEALLAHYAAAAKFPSIPLPVDDAPIKNLLFRRSYSECAIVTNWVSVSGRNDKGTAGWKHLALCQAPARTNQRHFSVDAGWSRTPTAPVWAGGHVGGIISEDDIHHLRLIMTPPAPGLEQSALPSPTSIPNNHFAYAVQWFLFAGIATIIYGLAALRRVRHLSDFPS